MILKWIQLIPFGLDHTIELFKKKETTKIVWREVGFLKYYSYFKKNFRKHKLYPFEPKPISLKWVKEFLEILIQFVNDLIDFDRDLQL